MIPFESDMTLRWACRTGDFVVWARCGNILLSGNLRFQIVDIWQLTDGDSLTLTNRTADLPQWFDLHPKEVSGLLSFWMMKRLQQGYTPKEGIEAPNLWRVFAGDRIVWVGPDRGGQQSNNGVLGLVDFRENALVYGESLHIGADGWPNFGGFDHKNMSPESSRLCQAGWSAVVRSGYPCVVNTEGKWAIG